LVNGDSLDIMGIG